LRAGSAERRPAPRKTAVLASVTLPGRGHDEKYDNGPPDPQPLQEKIEKSVRV